MILEHGYIGFYELTAANSATRLGFVDLAISLTLITVWMWFDTKRHGRPIVPYIAITVLLGCPGPLIYLIRRKVE